MALFSADTTKDGSPRKSANYFGNLGTDEFFRGSTVREVVSLDRKCLGAGC
jgi:hypothetical protein